jgi:phage shock protein PspC (stress-responsive transcriptional regulator)
MVKKIKEVEKKSVKKIANNLQIQKVEETPTNSEARSENTSNNSGNTNSATPRLFRSETDKMIGGVAGGIAKYLDIDSVIIRLFFLILLFGAGSGFLIYILLWIILPSENSIQTVSKGVVDENIAEVKSQAEKIVGDIESGENKNGRLVIGGLVIILGVFIFLRMLGWDVDFNWMWPWVIIAFGVVLIVRK